MEKKINSLKKDIQNLIEIKDTSINVILDSYEINLECYNFIKSRDESWLSMFYKLLEKSLEDNKYDINQ